MAWGRKKSGGRKEPLFGLAAPLGDLRLGPQDRIPGGETKAKKPAVRRKPVEDDDDFDDEDFGQEKEISMTFA